MFKIVEFSHLLIEEFYNKNKHKNLTFIDATCGNGNDTLFLAKILKNKGRVIAYDIQKIAIDNTKKRISKTKFNNIFYHLSSHEFFVENEFDLVIYNLGYLPGFDKTITTKVESTINSIKNALTIVSTKEDFLIIIVLYPGHNEGLLESKQIDNFCYNLSSKTYLVCKYLNYNRPSSPYIITIGKNKLLKKMS